MGLNIFMNTNIKYVIAVLLPFLLLAKTTFIDLGDSCGPINTPETRPLMNFTASPYPILINASKVHLNCSAKAVQKQGSRDQIYIYKILFYRDGYRDFHACSYESWRKKIWATCDVHVSVLEEFRSFRCKIVTRFEYCNEAKIIFDVKPPVAPKITLLVANYVDRKKIEVTCKTSGLPAPNVSWLINATRVLSNSSTVDQNTNGNGSLGIKAIYPHVNINTTNDVFQNNSDTYSVTSKIVVSNNELGLHVKCVSQNLPGKTLSQNVYFYYMGIQAMNINLVTTKVNWSVHPDLLYLSISSYNVSITCGDKFTKAFMDLRQTSVSISYPTPFRTILTCIVDVRGGSSNKSDLLVGTSSFTTLDQNPAPRNVSLLNISDSSAIVRWTAIRKLEFRYDRLVGYRINLANKTVRLNYTIPNEFLKFSLRNLSHSTNYEVSVTGVGENFEGKSSAWMKFKTTAPLELKTQDYINTKIPLTVQRKNNLTLTIIVSLVCLTAVVILLLIFILLLIQWFRNDKYCLAAFSKTASNEMDFNNAMINLRILFLEYFGSYITSDLEDTSEWEIDRSQLAIFDHVLGGGYFGFVREGLLMKTSFDESEREIRVAVKTLRANRGQNDCHELIREFEILQYVNTIGHENVIKLHGACTQEVPILLVMEFCCRGNLKEFLKESRINREEHESYENIYSKLTEKQLINFASKIAKGLMFLNEQKIVHRDIACRNILLTEQLVPKIADFGLARKIDVTRHYIVNKNKMLPVKWMSLESLLEGRFTSASDTWSYGVLLWEICTLGKEPYEDTSPYDMFDYLAKGNRMTRPSHCSKEIYLLMSQCWQQDEKKRPSFSDIHLSLENMLIEKEKHYINVRLHNEVDEITSSAIENHTEEDSSSSGISLTAAMDNDSGLDFIESGVNETAF